MQFHTFTTDRYTVQDWRSHVDDPAARTGLTAALTELLTPPVLAHLPPSLQLGIGGDGAISSWIDARDSESRVMIITSKADGRLIGLLILATKPDMRRLPVIHVGYLFSRSVWGQGAATEVLLGLVSALRQRPPARLVGGVDRQNPRSARVLEKAGFVMDAKRSGPQHAIYTRDIR